MLGQGAAAPYAAALCGSPISEASPPRATDAIATLFVAVGKLACTELACPADAEVVVTSIDCEETVPSTFDHYHSTTSSSMEAWPTETTTTSSTTNTHDISWNADIFYAAFPEEPLSELRMHVQFDDQNYGFREDLNLNSCSNLVDGAALSMDGADFVFDFSALPNGLDSATDVLRCSWQSHPPADQVEESWFDHEFVSALDVRGDNAGPIEICATNFTIDGSGESSYRCGDVDRSGAVAGTDALMVLRTAVGIAPCDRSRCDVDRSGGVTSSDALRILQRTIGLAVSLLCPATCGA